MILCARAAVLCQRVHVRVLADMHVHTYSGMYTCGMLLYVGNLVMHGKRKYTQCMHSG